MYGGRREERAGPALTASLAVGLGLSFFAVIGAQGAAAPAAAIASASAAKGAKRATTTARARAPKFARGEHAAAIASGERATAIAASERDAWPAPLIPLTLAIVAGPATATGAGLPDGAA